jgi:hypothetical protein
LDGHFKLNSHFGIQRRETQYIIEKMELNQPFTKTLIDCNDSTPKPLATDDDWDDSTPWPPRCQQPLATDDDWDDSTPLRHFTPQLPSDEDEEDIENGNLGLDYGLRRLFQLKTTEEVSKTVNKNKMRLLRNSNILVAI